MGKKTDSAPVEYEVVLTCGGESPPLTRVDTSRQFRKPSTVVPTEALLSSRRRKDLAGGENAARVMLNWALTGSASGQELAEVGSGGRFAVLSHETHAVPALAGQRE